MYRFGRGVRKSKKRHLRKMVVMLLLILIFAGLFWLYLFMQGDDSESVAPQAITREYAPVQTNTNKAFDAPEFHMELPNDWVFKEHQTNPYNKYMYQASAKNEDNRWVEIYVDSLPPNQTFNRIRPASLASGKLEPIDQISENCYESAGNKPVPQQTYVGITYQCDVNNYSRNVVGVGVAGQGTSLKFGDHTFMIIYTDHNMRPNYQILDNMLKSFSVKD